MHMHVRLQVPQSLAHSVEPDKLFELNEHGIPVDDVCMTRELSFKGDGMSSHKKFAL